MSDNIISSPPCPIPTTTSRGLLRELEHLREWILEEQVMLRPLIPEKYRDRFADPDPIPAESVWERICVLDKATNLQRMRFVREAWDAIVRDFERLWDEKRTCRRRFEVVMMAQSLLADAFVEPEQREAKLEKAESEARKMFKKYQKHMRTVLESEPDDETEADPDFRAEEDDWMNDEEGGVA